MARTASAPSRASGAPSPGLRRQIALYAATCITVGNIVGSGIFRSPHTVAQHLPTLGLVLAAWLVGGILSLTGSLALAELAAAHPKTGGLYVFIREGFGDAWAFTFGWANLWVIKPTVIASIASVFAIYFADALGLGSRALFPVGAAAILVLTAINWTGVRQGAGTQSLFTTLKMIGIAGLCAAAFLVYRGTGGAAAPPAPPPSHSLALAFVVAMIPILFAYDGWTDSTYVGGEIVRPRRTLPIAIVGGTLIVIVAYLLTNTAYYRVLAPGEIAQHEAVGAEAMRRIFGGWGGQALAVLVAVSTFGTINGAILTGPRVTQAMAADGLLVRRAAHIDPARGTPTLALWLQGALSIVWLYFAAGFEDVSGWFVTTSWLFYGVAIAALFRHRRGVGAARRAGTPLGEDDATLGRDVYRTPLYPLTPAIFILVTVVLIASDLGSTGWRAAAGVLVAATGFPVYYAWKAGRRMRRAS